MQQPWFNIFWSEILYFKDLIYSYENKSFYLPLAAGHQAHNWGVVDVEDALEVGPLGHHPS